MSGVSSTSSSRSRSRTISPVDDASATTRLTAPKRELSWWWSTLTTSGALCSTSGSGPSRLSFAQSSASRTRAAASSGSDAAQVVERHPRVLARQRRLAGEVHDRVLAERVERELRREQRPERIAVRVLVRRDEEAVVRADRLGDGVEISRCVGAARSGGELIDQLAIMRTPSSTVRIVFEGELRSPLHPQLVAQPRLEHAVGRREPRERLLALALVAEHADEDARCAQVGRRLDPGHGHEPDPRVLQLADRLRERLRIASFTRRMRQSSVPRSARSYRLTSARHELVLLPVEVPHRLLEQALQPRRARAHAGDRRAARAARARGGRPPRPRRRSGSAAAPWPT